MWFSAALERAGMAQSLFRVALTPLDPLSGLANVQALVTVARLDVGMSRTYEAAEEADWVTEFESDILAGVFSAPAPLMPADTESSTEACGLPQLLTEG
jgi:hypothetical protein